MKRLLFCTLVLSGCSIRQNAEIARYVDQHPYCFEIGHLEWVQMDQAAQRLWALQEEHARAFVEGRKIQGREPCLIMNLAHAHDDIFEIVCME
jgi:hypothetical protein